MSTRVVYNGKRIIPAPLVSIDKNYTRSSDGEIIGTAYSIKLVGTIIADRGSPNSQGDFYEDPSFVLSENIDNDGMLNAIIAKQEALRGLFSDNGKTLEIQSADGSSPLKIYPTINNISFPEGQWYKTCPYTIDMTADRIEIRGNGVEDVLPSGYSLESVSESWNIEMSDETIWEETAPAQGGHTYTVSHYAYRVTHNLSAKGMTSYDENGVRLPAWRQAQYWVADRIGFDQNIINLSLVSGIVPSSTYNYTRSENIDEVDGSCSVTETWLLSDFPYIEVFEVTVKRGETAVVTVGIDGNIRGLEERDSDGNITKSKYDNAKERFDAIGDAGFYSRASAAASGIATLNPVPLSFSVGHNYVGGVVSYNYEYDSRPSNMVSGTISETISLNNSWGVDIFGNVSVLGRTEGPVLQNLGMKQATTRELSIELVFGPEYTGISSPSITGPYSGDIQTIINMFNPVNSPVFNNNGVVTTADPNYIFVSNQSESWNVREKRYSYNVSWTYEGL